MSDSRRDSPLDDVDSFRILLDTYKDRQNGFVFATNPAALEYDGQVIGEGGMALGGGGGGGGRQQGGSGGGFNLNWDGAWRVRTAMTDDGWSAEFEIPFRTLRYEPGEGREWGVNFQRTIRRRKEIGLLGAAPLPVRPAEGVAGRHAGGPRPAGPAQPQADSLRARRDPRARRRGVAHDRARRRRPRRQVRPHAQPHARRHRQHRLRAGRSRRAADQSRSVQSVLSRRSGRSSSRTPGCSRSGAPGEAEVFFSRRIGIAETGEEIPILAGGRLSGKAGPVNVGLLNMQTDDTVTTAANNFTVARVRRDFANRSNLGAIFVGRYATGDQALAEQPQRVVRGGRALGHRAHRRSSRGLRRARPRPGCRATSTRTRSGRATRRSRSRSTSRSPRRGGTSIPRSAS